MNIILLLISIIFFGALIFFIKKKTSPGSAITRDIALGFGISAKAVEREVPVSYGAYGKGNFKMEVHNCIAYSIPHTDKGCLEWRLLQRFDKKYKSTDYWTLETAREPSQELRDAIEKFKLDFSEEFFEIEVKDCQVVVYWEEWGGKEVVQKIHSHLEAFSKIRA